MVRELPSACFLTVIAILRYAGLVAFSVQVCAYLGRVDLGSAYLGSAYLGSAIGQFMFRRSLSI